VLVESIPEFGDVFDIAWKANRRDYRLLTRRLNAPRRDDGRDWVFLLLALALAMAFISPLAFVVWLAVPLTRG
jgi:hypothetical protein